MVSGVANAQMVLSYSPWMPSGYVVNQAIQPWLKQVEEVTEGRVRIEPRAAGVGAPREQFDVVRDGLVDVSIVVTGYTQGRFPLMEVGELPFLSSDPEVLAPAFYRLYEEHLSVLNPFPGAHVLSTWNVTPAQIATRDDIIDSASRLRGLKLYISNAPVSSGVQQFGVVPVTASIAELYSMASTRVVDGAIFAFEPTVTWNLHPYLKNFTVVPGGVGQPVMAMIVSERKWAEISEQDREAIMSISGEALAADVGKVLTEGEREARQQLVDLGVVIEDMPEDVFSDFLDGMRVVDEAWVDKAERAGLNDAGEVLSKFRSELNGNK